LRPCAHFAREVVPTMDALNSPLLEPLLALIAGVLIFMRPALLSYIVAVYLIVVGVLGLSAQLDTRKNPVDFALVVTHSAELAVSEPGSR